MSPAANPSDPKFSSSLWTRTSENTRLSSFKYKSAEKILDNLYASELLHGMSGFKMCDHYENISDLPTRDAKLIKITSSRKNILFAGCSITSGTGLEVGERWIDHVYSKINNFKEYSGLFNIGQEGGSIQSQVDYIFKYCEEFGIPDIILFNIPDFWRMTIDNSTYKIYASDESEYSEDAVGKLACSIGKQAYSMLESFCKVNNIILLSISWDQMTNKLLKDKQTFVAIADSDLHKAMFKYDDGGPYAILARDGIHPGTAKHIAWSEIVLDKLSQML
jgi:hypothetical protein